MMKKNLLLILMCFVCGLVYAHDGLNFRNLDVKSGISDNYVRSVLRDQYGFMWFATLNGLNRYDGYQFKKYTTTQLGAYNNDIEFCRCILTVCCRERVADIQLRCCCLTCRKDLIVIPETIAAVCPS